MLSRRHLRIRVLQALYSFYQSGQKDALKTEHELFTGIEKTYDLFLFLLLVFPELSEQERIYRIDQPQKFILSGSEKKVVHSLSENTVVTILNSDRAFQKAIKQRNLSWQGDIELIKKIFHHLRTSEEYKQYITAPDHSPETDIDFCILLFKKFILELDFVSQSIEEKNLYWADGFEFASAMVLRTIKNSKPVKGGQFDLPYIYKDEADDRQFAKNLLHNTIKDDAYFMQIIDAKTKNWDVERIALVDVIMLKMALCEVLHLSTVPVKVSINEYLDIAKDFSTPKSNQFINGIIDKLVIDLKNENKIVKTGRGLVE